MSKVSRYQKGLLNRIEEAWVHHPDWSLGRLLQSAGNIGLGEIRTNPAYVRDYHLNKGLKALVPEGDE